MSDPMAPIEPFDLATTRTLAALFDTVVPEDEWAAGWAGGGERLLREHLRDFLEWAIPPLRTTVELLTPWQADQALPSSIHPHARRYLSSL